MREVKGRKRKGKIELDKKGGQGLGKWIYVPPNSPYTYIYIGWKDWTLSL